MLNQVELIVESPKIDQIADIGVGQQAPRNVSLVADGFLVEGLNDKVVVLP